MTVDFVPFAGVASATDTQIAAPARGTSIRSRFTFPPISVEGSIHATPLIPKLGGEPAHAYRANRRASGGYPGNRRCPPGTDRSSPAQQPAPGHCGSPRLQEAASRATRGRVNGDEEIQRLFSVSAATRILLNAFEQTTGDPIASDRLKADLRALEARALARLEIAAEDGER